MRYDVFLSYSSNDEPITQEAMRAMEATGIRCWLAPRELTAGDMWAAELVAAIDASRLMTIFLSRSAGESPHVLREVNRAVHKRLGLIVFRIENFPLSAALEYYLGPVHWLDATAPPVESHLAHLCDAILRLNPLGAPGAPGQPQLDPALFQPAWPPAEHPLLGRDAELAVLDRVWSAAMGGRARAVIVQGEAGSGKTRLLQELLMKHSGEPLFILVARALPEDARSPYEAIASALDPVIRLGPSMGLPAEALAEVERVRTRAYPDATPQQAQERRHWALAEFLRALCHRAPVVLFLDDVQWADDISLAFVQSLLIRNPRERIIILSTMRTDDTRSASPALLKFQNYLNKAELLTEITLAPLDPASGSFGTSFAIMDKAR